MPTIYRYTPLIEPGPDGRTIRHTNTDDGEIDYLCTLDGEVYLSVPDGVTLPTQPAEIALEPVTMTDQLRARLKAAAGPVRVSKLVTRENIRAVSGDAEDQIADLERRVAMAERLLYRMADAFLSGQTAPQSLVDEFLAPVQGYVAAVDAGAIKARHDAESLPGLIERLMARSTAVTNAAADHVARIDALLPPAEAP